MSKKIITWVKPTGSSMHLGNLMGAVLPFAKTAKWNDAAIFIADLHALTSVKDGTRLRDQSLEVAIEYLSIFGIDTPITIFRQSDIHEITKLMWIIANVTPYSLMLRAHSFKDNEAKNIDINMWVFNYPILMAADIIGYDIDAVPVGKDQIQHMEMTRDIARAFNKTYGQEVFVEPEAIIAEEVATLPGIDGRKMSKSYDNFIGIFDDEKMMKKRIMSITTDSLGVDDAKNPDTCNVFALIQIFGTPEEVAIIRTKYETPNIGFGYGHAKTALLDILMRYLEPYRTNRAKLLSDIPFVEAKLTEGAKIMNARLEAKMKVVKELVGVN
jgi:tryptophanyl-tRNA synthetase